MFHALLAGVGRLRRGYRYRDVSPERDTALAGLVRNAKESVAWQPGIDLYEIRAPIFLLVHDLAPLRLTGDFGDAGQDET